MKRPSDAQLLAIGYSLSICSGIFLLILGFARLDSIAIGLLLAVLTTLLKIKADVSKNHDEFIEAIGINKSLNEDENFRKAIYALAKDYIEIKSSNPREELLFEEAQTTVNRCVAAVAELANGRLSIEEEHRRQIYMCRIVSECTKSVKAVTYLSTGQDGWWTGTLGRKYFDEQKEAIATRNVVITRIFIVSDQETENLRERFTTHKNIGIEVRVAEQRLLPKTLLRNFLICDDKWFIDSRFDRFTKKNDGGYISKHKAEVNSAIEKWNDLIGLSEPLTDVNEYTNPSMPTQTP